MPALLVRRSPSEGGKGRPSGLGAAHDELMNCASRSPIQADYGMTAYPGLKLWAVLWDHFRGQIGNYPTLFMHPHPIRGSARRSAYHSAGQLRAKISAGATGKSGALPYQSLRASPGSIGSLALP
jgi:hypothetical protein